MIALLLCLLQQDEFNELCKKIAESQKDVKYLTADVAVEKSGKVEDSSMSSKGALAWRVKERELLTEITDKVPEGAKPVRTLAKGDEATVHFTKERRAEVYKVAQYPFVEDLLREGVTERLKETWDVAFAARPDETKLPDLHTKKEGGEKPEDKPKPPDAKLPGTRGANALVDVEAEEGKYIVLLLKPKKEPLKGYVESIKLFVHKDSLRVEKVALETPMESVVMRFTNWKTLDAMDELTLDLSNAKVERK